MIWRAHNIICAEAFMVTLSGDETCAMYIRLFRTPMTFNNTAVRLLRRYSGTISVLVLSTLLTLLVIAWMGYDVRELSRQLIGSANGDTQLNSWLVYQAMDNLLHRPTTLGYSAIFYSDPQPFAYTIAPYGIAVVSLPLFLITGGNLELTYNLYFISTYVLTAWATCLLARYLFKASAAVAVLVGLMVGFAQFRMLHFMHIETLSTQFYLLAVYCLHRLLDRPGIRWALALAFTGWLTMSTSGNLGMMLVVTAAIVVGYAILRHRRELSWSLLGLLALTAIITLVALWPLVSFRLGNPVFARGYSLSEMIYYSSTPLGWFVGFSWIYSKILPAMEEKTICIGLTPLILAFVAWRQRKRALEIIPELTRERVFSIRELVVLYGIITLVGYLFSLGPGFKLSDTLIIPLPYILLVRLPGFSSIRVSARYIFMAITGTALLSAYGLTYVEWRDRPSFGRLLLPLVALCLFAELFPNPGNPPYLASGPPVIDTSAYDWLSRQPPNTLILEYPMDTDGTHFYINLQRRHKQLLINGKGSYVPDWLRQVDTPDFPTDGAITFLQSRQVRYILVHYELVPPAEMPRLRARLQRVQDTRVLTPVGSFGQVDVYQLEPSAGVIVISANRKMGSFYNEESAYEPLD
jgi:hypothetical protein